MAEHAQGIAAVIFDLDGLLIDSEPLWQRAEIEVFGRLGVALTAEMCRETAGLRIDDVVAHWQAFKPWPGASAEEVADAIVARMAEMIAAAGQAMPGAIAAVKLCHDRGLPAAIATSARRVLAEAAVTRLGLGAWIAGVCSAEDEQYGKPHPAVYLAAARLLGAAPERCLAVEDSINGVISAKAARMRVLAVPYPDWKDDPRFVLADVVLESLEMLTAEWLAGQRKAGP